jgi:hypothetical protein
MATSASEDFDASEEQEAEEEEGSAETDSKGRDLSIVVDDEQTHPIIQALADDKEEIKVRDHE